MTLILNQPPQIRSELNSPQLIISMNHQPSIQLLTEINQFKKQWFMEDYEVPEVYRRYHIVHRKHRNYEQKLSNALSEGYQLMERQSFFKLGNLFVELSEIEPAYWTRYSFQKDQYLYKCIANLKATRDNEAAMGFSELIARIIGENELTTLVNQVLLQSHANTQAIQTKLKIFQKVFQWETIRRKTTLTNRIQQVYRFMQIIINAFQSTNLLNSQNISSGKIKLFNTCLRYFLSQLQGNKNIKISPLSDKSQLLKGIVLQQIKKYQISVPFSQQGETQLFNLVSNSVKLYGIYNEAALVAFINNNNHNISKMPYLELIYSMVQKCNQLTLDMKDMFHRIFSRIFSQVVVIHENGCLDAYKRMKLMSDIIIKASSIYPFDFTKQINKLFLKFKQDFYTNFLTSLLLVYQFKMSREVLDSISADHRKIYNQNKYNDQYQLLLTSFGTNEMNIIDFISDPEAEELIIWNLLAIRNSVIVNFQFLLQNNLVNGTYVNLMKLTLSNIYPQQCAEICHQLFQHQSDLQRGILGRLDIPKIIEHIFSQCEGLQPTKQSLQCFANIITRHKKFVPLFEIQHFILFPKICNMIILVLENRDKSKEFRTIAVNLLRLCLPNSLEQSMPQNISQSFTALTKLVQTDFTVDFFDVYLDLMLMAIPNTHLRELYLYDNIRISQKLSIAKVLANHVDKYQILHYMLKGGDFSQQAVQKAWQIIKDLIPMHQRDLCLHVIQLFAYFGRKLKRQPGNAYRRVYTQYLKGQISKTVSAMSEIGTQLIQTVLIEDLIALFEMQQAFHMYTFQCLIDLQQETQFYPGQMEPLVQYVCNDLKLLDDVKWAASFRGVGKCELQQSWGLCYLSLLMLVCKSNRMNRRNEYQRLDYIQPIVMDKFKHVKNMISSQGNDSNESMLKYYCNLSKECSKILRYPLPAKNNRRRQ